MSDENQRSIKRRKVNGDYDHSQIIESSTTIAGEASRNTADIASAARRAAQHVHNVALNGGEQPSQSANDTRKFKDDSINDVVQDDESASSEKDSDDEPRRSGRQRKPSAKILSSRNDAAAVTTPRKPHAKRTPQSKKVTDVKTLASRTASPAAVLGKPRPLAASHTKKSAAKRGTHDEPVHSVDLEKTPPPIAPFTTVKKRGRPPGSGKKPVITLAADETPESLRVSLSAAKADSPSHAQEPMADVREEEVAPKDDQAVNELQAALNTMSAKLHDATFSTAAASKIVLEKLAQRRPTPLTHLQEEYDKVYTLLESTVTAGEGNSMVLVGARGSGKTTLVNKALAELAKTQKEYFHIVHLNGFIQTDDKLALREIWRQLGREMELEEESGGGTNKSYADTLTMLLALLSHPDEIARGHENDALLADGTPTAVDQVARSVIIVMDEFDLFATHARQTLLYNLLDIAQSRKAPIAVLGLTTKFDVTERLEKRVKSRFSHRYVHLPLAKSMHAFQDICKAAVLLQSDELSFDERLLLSQSHASESKSLINQSRLMDFLAMWNTSVHLLFLSNDFKRAYLRDTFYLTKSVSAVLTSLLLPMSSLPTVSMQNGDVSLLPISHFLSLPRAQHLQAPSSSLQLLLTSLSELQLSLLIAAARLDIIHDIDTCSFGMAYAHYVELASKARLHSAAAGALATGGAGARVWGRDVARGEWEVLIRRGLLLPVSEISSTAGAATSVGALVKVDVRLEEISGAVKGISAVIERWCKQI